MELRYLYVQELVASGMVRVKKVLGTLNPADILTKYIAKETWFSFSWEHSGGNGHFVSGYWSGEPVLDTTGTLHGGSQPTFLDVSDPPGEHFARQPRGMGTFYDVPHFATGYFASSCCSSPGHWVLSGAACRYTWNFAVPIPCCTLMCHGSTATLSLHFNGPTIRAPRTFCGTPLWMLYASYFSPTLAGNF